MLIAVFGLCSSMGVSNVRLRVKLFPWGDVTLQEQNCYLIFNIGNTLRYSSALGSILAGGEHLNELKATAEMVFIFLCGDFSITFYKLWTNRYPKSLSLKVTFWTNFLRWGSQKFYSKLFRKKNKYFTEFK